ncbi:MAG: PAS domain-containing protein, partial [Acetobacteraceae bacterium]
MLLVLATTAPLAAYGMYHAISGYFQQRAALIGNTQALARGIAQLTARELDRDVLNLEILATTPTLQAGNYAAFAPQAREFLAGSDPGGAIAVFDVDGQTLSTTGGEGPRRPNPDTSARVFATAAPVVSDLDAGQARMRRMTIDVPVMRDERVVADLVLHLPLMRMQAIVMAERLPRGWRSAILDGSGRVVAHSLGADAVVGASPSLAIQRWLSSGAADGTVDIAFHDGTAATAMIERTARFGWSAAVAVPRAQIFASLRDTVGEMVTVGALALALSLGFAMLIARRLARPVTTLARLAVALDGDELPRAHEPGLREADAVARVLQDAVRRRRLAEDSAKDAELRATRLIEAVPCGLIGFDPEGNWSFVNRATCDLLARSAAELLGFSVRSPELGVRAADGAPIPPEERASARALRGEVVRDLEVSMRRGTGGRIALLLSAVPLRDR